VIAGEGNKIKKHQVSLEIQTKKAKTHSPSKKQQRKLDHEQHYDLDGVSEVNGKIVIPSYCEVNK